MAIVCKSREEFRTQQKTSKMELLEKLDKIFKNTSYFCNNIYLSCLTGFKCTSEEYLLLKYQGNLTRGNSFCKVTGSKALISMKQDSTREKREHYCKVSF